MVARDLSKEYRYDLGFRAAFCGLSFGAFGALALGLDLFVAPASIESLSLPEIGMFIITATVTAIALPASLIQRLIFAMIVTPLGFSGWFVWRAYLLYREGGLALG